MSASQDALRTIAYISTFDKERAARLQDEYNRRKTDKNDKYYAGAYSAPTNQAVSNLTALGFDTSVLNQDWFDQNKNWIWNNLEYRSGTTNAPSAPTKKSSWENRVAYELYQWENSEEQTQKAEKQWNQLQNELAYYAGNLEWNYSDDYILNNKIDWSKYNLLTEMDEDPNPLNPKEYNRAIGYSKDAVNGTLWAARNGGGTGNDLLNAGMYYLGEGNQWQEDPKVSAKLNPENPDFNPYDIGSTNMHKEGQILGMYSSSRDWVDSDEFKKLYFSDDPEEKAAAENWYNAEMQYTRPAEDARDALYGYIDSFLSDGVTDAGVVRTGIDAALDAGKLYKYQKGEETVYTTKKPSVKNYEEIDLSILNKIDMTVGKTDENGNRSLPVNDEKDLLTFTRGIGYKYDSTIQQVEELCARNAEILNEADTVNDIIDLGMGPLNPALFSPEPATVGTEQPQMQSPGQIAGQDTRTGTQPGMQGTPSPEINTGAQAPAGTEPASVTIDAAQDAMKNGRMSSPTDLPPVQPEPAQVPTTPALPKITEAEAGEIEAGNKKINEARTAVETEGVTTETETATMKYAGSVAFNRIKNQLTAIRINPGIMQGVVQKDINIASKGVMDSGLNYAHSIAEYETTKIRNDANQERYAALEAKYGDIQYYQKEAPEAIEKQIGDYTVILTLDTANPDGPKYVVSDIHSSYATYNEIMDTAWGEDLKKQAEMLGEPESKEAAKILNAQSVVAANGEQGAVEIEEYKNLSAQISKDSQALEQGKENYDKAADGLKKTVNKLNMMADSAYMMGVDPSGVRDAFRFLDDMLNYHDEPAVPMQDRTKLEMIDAYAEYTGMEYDSAKKSEILHKQISDVEARIKKIDEDIAYAQGIGYQIPGNYARNMQLKREDLENEKKALEYSAILTDTAPEELEAAINAAKAFEEKYGEGSMNYWVNLFDNADGFRTIMKNDRYTLREDGEDASEYGTITEDEKKTYYYLLGKKILEMGGSLDEALENIGKDPKAAEAALREIFSDASEYEKFMENDQSGYGLWNNREYDQSVEYGRGMVQSGTGGGIEANLMATGATVGESIASALYTFDRLISGGRFNEKAFANRLTGTKNAIREETRNSIDEYYKDNPLMKTIANIGYEIYCNRGDSAMNAMFFGMMFPEIGNPILSELLGSTPMGFTAGLNAATEAVRNGANTEQAWLILGTTFMAETMTEALTRSNIMEALGEGRELTKETLGQFFKEWLTNSGVEEMFGESANDLIENFFNRGAAEWFDNPNFESDHQKLIDKYYAEGYTEPGAAEAKAYEEEMKGIAHTAFVSYLSAGADVVAKVGRAAVNTVKTAADVVNGYRKETRADQRLGGSNSMLDNMIRDYKKAKSGVPAAVAMGGPNTNKNTSEQEAGAAAPETMQAAQTATDERFTKAEQGRREARETLDAAKEEYDRAYSNARSKERKLDNAKKGLKAAQKGGNQEQIAMAQQAVDNAQEEYNQAKAARVEAKTKRDAAREQMERADSEYDEAGRAIATENATPDQKQASADVATLQRVEGSTPVTQTETLASILDNGDGDEAASEQASAAATLLMKRFGENANYIVQQVMNGTAKTAESRELVTTALQNAALGNGAATAVMQSADFQNASSEQKVQMLVATIAQDQANQAVQQNIAASVRDFRIAMGVNNLAATGHFDGAVSAQAAAQAAGKDVSKAKTSLTEREQALDQALQDAQQKADAVKNDPSDINKKEHHDAVTNVTSADESRKQYEDHLTKEQEKKDAADAKATQETENAMKTAREQATQEVDQVDQQRNEKEQYRQALIDNGIIDREYDTHSGAVDLFASEEEMQARENANFSYDNSNGDVLLTGDVSENVKQMLEDAGFSKREGYNADTGESGEYYVINQNNISPDQLKVINDAINAEKAQMKAEEDERTGKAQEDREDSIIAGIADAENRQGEDRSKRIDELKKQAEKVKIRITDLNKKVSNTEGALAVYAFSRKLGIPIEFGDLGAVNGKRITRGKYVYNKETGEAKIVLNQNLIKSGKMSVGQALVEASLHEIIHSMRNTDSYNTFRNVAMQSVFKADGNTDTMDLYENNADFRAKVDYLIEERKAAGDEKFLNADKKTQIEAAEEEIVADFARMNLAEKDVVQRFMDAGLGGQMRNTLHNINQALKNYVGRLTGKPYAQWKESAEKWNAEHAEEIEAGKLEKIDIQTEEEFFRTREYLRRAERAFQKAMIESAKSDIHPNSDSMSVSQIAESMKMGMIVNDDTLQLFMPSENGDIIGDGTHGTVKGQRYTEIDGVTEGKRIEPDMIVNTPVGMLIDMGLSNEEFTDEEGNVRTQQGDARKMFADLMNLCARYKDNNLIWEIAGSEFSEAFSALKSNSDPQYKNTVDFGTICSKTQAIVDVLSQSMINRVNEIRQWNEAHRDEIKAGTVQEKVFTGLNREDIMKVYDITHNAGLSVPCPVCYVFSRWMGVPGMLGQMNRFQHEYVSLAKDENGNTLYDKNGDAVVNWDETFTKANGYLQDMVREYTKTKDNPDGIDLTDPNLTQEQRMEAIKLAKEKIAYQKNSINGKITRRQKTQKNLYEQIGALQEKLEKQDLTERERKKIEEQIAKKKAATEKNDRDIDQFEEDKKKFEAFNWVSQVLCVQHTEGKATVNDLNDDGTFVMDKDNFRYTPEEILFDLNRSGEFAGYAKNWRYRTTRGAGMGKAIMPYSGASIGDIIRGTALRWKQSENPLLQMDRAAAKKAFENAKKRVRQQNLVGGQRFQSTSDFRPEWGLDYIMSFLEMQALGSKVQMYTKVVEAVDFLGSIGADVNLSIMAKNNGYHEATPEELALSQQDTDEGRELKSRMGTLDGKTYVMDFSDVTGMEYGKAKDKSKKFNSVQMILVGMNDVHIRLALGNEDIDFVIPWHSSGNSKDVLQQLVSSVKEVLEESSDYTDFQTDQIKSHKEGKGKNEKTIDDRTENEIKLWDARVKLLTEGGEALTEEERRTLMSNDITKELYRRFTEEGYDPDCFGVKLTKDQAEQVFPYEYWDKTSTRENADVNGKRFVDYCDALGLVPRFSQFKDVPGYWKLLIDRKMYDNNVMNEDGTVKEYGKYREQKVVDVTKARMDNDPNKPLDAKTARAKKVYQLPESTTAKYGKKDYSEQTSKAIDLTGEYLSEKYDASESMSTLGDLTEADRDLMDDANTDYMSAVDRGDMEAAREDLDFYAEQKGYVEKWAHGSRDAAFTVFDLSKVTGAKAIFLSDPFTASNYTDTTPNPVQTRLVGKDVETIEDALSEIKRINKYEPEKVDGGYKITPNISLLRSVGKKDVYSEEDVISYANQLRSDKKGGTYHLYVKPGNKLIVDANESYWNEIKSEYGRTTDQIANYAKRNGYDSVEINNVFDGDHIPSDVLIVFDGSRLKSAETVTYDDNGKPIPLNERFTDNEDIRYSTEGELTEADRDLMQDNERELNQALVDAGVITQEELEAYQQTQTQNPLEGQNTTMSTGQGPAIRAFAAEDGMLKDSDELDRFAKAVVTAQNTYFPDTNLEQVQRAVKWIRSLRSTPNSDGFAEAYQAIVSPSFDYRSADGQARMVAVMGMAAAKNDVVAQTAMADAFMRQGTDLGRALQARKLFKLMTPEGRQSTLMQMLQNAKDEMGKKGVKVDLKFSDWVMQAAAFAETEEDMAKARNAAIAELAEQLPASWKDRLNSIRMLAMLGNPRTHIRNIIGNAMFIPAVSLKNKLGALMELGVKKGNKTKTLAPAVSKEIRDFAREDANNIKGLLTGEAKYNEAAQIKQQQAPLGKFMKALSDLNSNALEGEDWFFLKGHYRRALGGWMQANGYTVEQVKNDKALLEKGRQYAISEAQKATYRDFSKTAQTLNDISRKGGLLGFGFDAVLPFKKTPVNIMRRGIEYSPVGIAKALTYDMYRMKQYMDYQNGKLDTLPEKALSPTQVIDHICGGLSGTLVMALGYLLAGAGAATCGLDDDEDKFEKTKGNQEYALNPGKAVNSLLGFKLFGEDVTFTLDWAAPLSMPFFVGAAIREQFDSEGDVSIDDVLNAVGGITEPVFNLSMLDGVNTLLKTSSYDNTNPIEQIGAKIGTNYLSSYVPSLLGAIARTSMFSELLGGYDGARRKSFVPADQSKGIMGNARYAHENAQNKIPFYNQQNIPVRDIWGNKDIDGLAERLLENFILPGYVKQYKEDPIINEMARLYEATGDTKMIPEEDPAKTITYTVKSTKEKVKHVLTDKEWDRYKEVRGQTAFKELTALLENEDYQNATDAVQVQMIKDVWSHADKVGQQAVIPDIDADESNDATVTTIARDAKITGCKNEMIKALNTGDSEAYNTMVQALYDEGLTESDVKGKIRDNYRDQYKDACRKGNEARKLEIEEILDSTGFDFDGLIESWQESVSEETEPAEKPKPKTSVPLMTMGDFQ